MPTDKIILFIVEGLSDEQSLAPALDKIITTNSARFKVMRGDITSDLQSNVDNIEKRIVKQCVKKFIKENPQYQLSDICEVVHIVDLDGAFISDDKIKENPSITDPIYCSNKIVCKDKESFLQSHHNKKDILNKISSIDSLQLANRPVPYSVFYMSSNLDHVLHNKPNATKREKQSNSIKFGDEYDDPITFEDFFNKPIIKIPGDYKTTWLYAQKDNNSLKRGSNFWLCIKTHK